MHRGMIRDTAHRITAGLLGLVALAACAGAQSAEDYRASLQTATAGVIGIADATSIAVTEEARVGAKWTWKAAAGGKSWVCDADDQMRLPSCTQET